MTKDNRFKLVLLLAMVLAVRLVFLGLFHHRIFSGPSTQFEQAFVAINLLDGQGVKTFKEPPPAVAFEDPNRLLDPERYMISSPVLLPYIKEVPGYGFFLAGLWKLFDAKLWIFAQLAQLLLELLAAWSLYALGRRFFGRNAGLLTVLVFAFLFYEVRASVIPYKDIFLLYVMLVITHFSSRIFLREGRPWFWFIFTCVGTGIGYYFMPSIVLYPLFLIAALGVLRRINVRQAAAFVLLAIAVVGIMVWPYQSYVRAHRDEPGVAPPLFWYRFWLGSQVRAFYSTEEERFQDYFRERMQATGRSIEAICKEEFFAHVKAHPVSYALQTAKKLIFGTFLVYGNAGDAAYSTSWSHFKSENPQAGFTAYAGAHPLRILGMLAGTLSASFLFPIALIALFLLRRDKRLDAGLFLFSIPLYFLLLHMFFHYEARYLAGTLAGYLPLAGYVLSKIRMKGKSLAVAETPQGDIV